MADIDAARRQRRTGLCYAFQDGIPFESEPGRLEVFHRLGVRMVQPTYNRRNLLGDGCLEPDNAGLSRTGIEAVERMDDLGILVDLSHCGRKTAADAIRTSKQPVVFSHTGCAALAEHPRNRTDAELRAIADKGGVAGIYFMPYLRVGFQPTAADVIRHVERASRPASPHRARPRRATCLPPTSTRRVASKPWRGCWRSAAGRTHASRRCWA